MNVFLKKKKTPLVVIQSYEERESVKVNRPQKDGKEEKVPRQRTIITKSETSTRDRQGVSEVVKEVTILSKKATDTPPPPPPMPTSDLKNSNSSWKSSPASSVNGSPPACPTPDYDTSSTVSSSSSPHIKPQQSHNIPTYATVNKINKQVLSPATNGIKTSQKSLKNSDSMKMQSIESFILTNPQSQKPKPPDTYFVVPERKAKLANGSDSSQLSWRAEKLKNKPRPLSITIGEYPTGVERRAPTRFDFLPSHNAGNNSTSDTDGSSISHKLQSELTQTLLRSNLRKKTTVQEELQNGITSAKGTVTISVNSKPSVENHFSTENNNNNSRSKVSIVTSEYKNQVPSASKPSVVNAIEKMIKTSGGNNRVTIMVSNGVNSKQ